MSMLAILTEYVLVYCTSRGLSSIGEPPPNKSKIVVEVQPSSASSIEDKLGMPIWITSIFIMLYGTKYTVSLMVWYMYSVICTVVIVASSSVSVRDAAMAEGQENSQRVRLEKLALQLNGMQRFKQAVNRMRQRREERRRSERINQDEDAPEPSILRRRSTLLETHLTSFGESPLSAIWQRFTLLPCFRGFIASLYLAVPQWYLSFVIDWLLSGQPKEHQLGYGTTSIVLATCFGGGYAVWTHYCITKPTNKKILEHFPKGREVLMGIWDITAFWAVCEHLPSSLSLSLSRWWELKDLAFDAESWNKLDQTQQMLKIGQFTIVLLMYGIATAMFAVPATMILRRVYASMLSDEDLAIVPFNRGEQVRTHNDRERSKLHPPGLSYSQAWNTIRISQYIQVLGIYLQYFIINQLIQVIYWVINWKLQEAFNVNQYTHTKLPYAPIGVILPLGMKNATLVDEVILHSEL